MDAHEVVVPIVNRKRGLKTGKLLGKGVCQSSKSTHVHSHGQILPFHQRGRNVFLNRISNDGHDLDATDMARTITARCVNNIFGD